MNFYSQKLLKFRFANCEPLERIYACDMPSWTELRTKTLDSLFKGLEISKDNFYDFVYEHLLLDAKICGECDAETIRLSREMYEDVPDTVDYSRRLPTFDDFFNGLDCLSSLLTDNELDDLYYELLNEYQYGYESDMFEARYEREQEEEDELPHKSKNQKTKKKL